MYLYRRGNVWWVKFRKDNKVYQKSCRTENKKVAQAWANSIETARKMPTFEEAVEVLKILFGKPREGAIELEAAWEIYLEVARSIGRDKVSGETIRKRAAVMRNFCDWIKKEIPTIKTAEAVTAPIAARYAAELARTGRKSKTRRNILGDLSTIWKLLEKASAKIQNPWGNLSPIDDDSERGKAFSREEVERVLAAARAVGKDWEGVVTIALHTGLRHGDVAMLEWRQIEGGIIRVTPRKTQRHGIQTVFPITEPIRQVLDGVEKRGDFIFPLHAEMYEKSRTCHHKLLEFSEVLKAAGLEGRGFTFHSLRHTAATRLAEAGIGIEIRKRILGHTEDATAERYDHAEHLEEVREAMEKAATI